MFFEDKIKKYNEKILEVAEIDKKKVEKEINKSMKRLDLIKYYSKQTGIYKYFKYKTWVKIFLAIEIALIIIIGLINIESYPIYIAGIIFLLVGFFVGLCEEKFGLIFLVTHGLTGFGVMIGPSISNVINNPIFQDKPTNIWIYLGIVAVILIIAIILVVIYNLNDLFQEKKFIINKIFLLLIISIFAIMILPNIIDIVYSF